MGDLGSQVGDLGSQVGILGSQVGWAGSQVGNLGSLVGGENFSKNFNLGIFFQGRYGYMKSLA